MSIRKQTPEPGEGEFWIDLPPPAAKPAPAEESAPEAPAVSGDDPGAIFAPDRGTDAPAVAQDEEPGLDAHPDELATPLSEQSPSHGTTEEPPNDLAPAAPVVDGEHVAEDLAAEPELEEEGAAAFVPVLLGGALALAIAIGLEAAGLWSTLLPP